ncbi:MAG TPA: TIGR03435 family protein [Bryobacteraceae bacterium]|nr:TIGR03435 family protein [Bryobacteraceae bacterium]
MGAFVGVCLLAQTAGPKFEVASIKPSDPGARGFRVEMDPGGRYVASGLTVSFMIQQAYDVHDFQITGGPDWIRSQRFDINAKPENGKGLKSDDVKMMIRAMLEERFQLKLGRETKDMPIYALVLGKGGVKMPESTVERDQQQIQMGRGRIIGKGMTTGMLAVQLSRPLGRTVLDKTGLTKNYDFTLEWTPDLEGQAVEGSKENAPTAPDTGISVFTAVQEQLGLKLEATKGPVDVLIVEHVGKPSEN